MVEGRRHGAGLKSCFVVRFWGNLGPSKRRQEVIDRLWCIARCRLLGGVMLCGARIWCLRRGDVRFAPDASLDVEEKEWGGVPAGLVNNVLYRFFGILKGERDAWGVILRKELAAG